MKFKTNQGPLRLPVNTNSLDYVLSRAAFSKAAVPLQPDTSSFQSYPICDGKLFRGACNTNPTGSLAVLNIRTKDTELDEAAIKAIALQLRLGFTPTSGLSKRGPQLHQTPRQGVQSKSSSSSMERLDLAVIPLCELSVANPGINVRVSLHQIELHSFYAVMAQRVPSEHLNSALESVKAVAGRLFELKEEPHFRDVESQEFRTKLATTTYL